MKKCTNCGSDKFQLKNVYLSVKDIDSNNILDLLPIKNELFYLKICLECGKVEIYSGSVILKDDGKLKKMKK